MAGMPLVLTNGLAKLEGTCLLHKGLGSACRVPGAVPDTETWPRAHTDAVAGLTVLPSAGAAVIINHAENLNTAPVTGAGEGLSEPLSI